VRQNLVLGIVLTSLTAMVFLASAATPPAQKKQQVPTAKAKAPAVSSKNTKSTAPTKPSSTVATKGKQPTASASRGKAAPARRTATASGGSRAVYSRSGRTQAARRGTTVSRPQSNWQSRPTPERYREIQQALADKGFFKGEVNGTWSTDSVEALKNFQKAENLDPDGKLGSLSLIALGLGPKRIAAATPTPPPPPQAPPSTPPDNPNRQP
jgi:hypothetical protein